MKTIVSKLTLISFLTVLLPFALFSQDSSDVVKTDIKDGKEQSKGFVDNDGDGYNDNAPDHDGDGIPNGLDSDYIKMKQNRSQEYVDLDGDGINDNMVGAKKNQQQIYRYKDGEHNVKPQDGSGQNGSGASQEKDKGKGKGNGNGKGGG